MHDYACVIFDLYNTIIDDEEGIAQREKYRLDALYTILEKSNFPVTFAELSEKYGEMTLYYSEYHGSTGKAFSPFRQVEYLLNSLKVRDLVVFKRSYDVYTEALLHIPPKPLLHAEKALTYLQEKGKKIGLISNTGRTPGIVLRLMLKEINLYDYFDDMMFSDEVGFLKPEKMIFDVAVERLGVDKKETIFIGDIKECDYTGAINAGLNAHLFDRNRDDLFQLALSYSGEQD